MSRHHRTERSGPGRQQDSAGKPAAETNVLLDRAGGTSEAQPIPAVSSPDDQARPGLGRPTHKFELLAAGRKQTDCIQLLQSNDVVPL